MAEDSRTPQDKSAETTIVVRNVDNSNRLQTRRSDGKFGKRKQVFKNGHDSQDWFSTQLMKKRPHRNTKGEVWELTDLEYIYANLMDMIGNTDPKYGSARAKAIEIALDRSFGQVSRSEREIEATSQGSRNITVIMQNPLVPVKEIVAKPTEPAFIEGEVVDSKDSHAS